MAEFSQQDITASKGSGSYLSLFTGIAVIIIIAMLVILSSTGIQFQRKTQLFEYIQEQQLIAQRILNDVTAISENREPGFGSLRMHSGQFERLLRTIRDDITGNGLAGKSDLMGALQAVEEIWQDYRINVAAVLDGEQSMHALMAMLNIIQASIPETSLSSEEVVRMLVENNAASNDVYTAARQMVLIQRIANGINEVGRARTLIDEDRLQIYAGIGRDSAIYEQTLQKMLGMEFDNRGDSRARDKINEIASHYQNISRSIGKVLDLESELAELNFAIQGIGQISPQFIQACESLKNIYSGVGQQRNVSPIVWSMLLIGLFILISLIIIQSRSVAGKKSSTLYDANPQDLIDYVAGEVKDIAKGSIRVEGKIPGRLPSPCLEGISDALEPMRRRAEFIDSTVAEILSISSGMHQSVINIVDAGERLAQQSNRAGSIVANIVVALRRATNDAASSMSVLNNMLIDIKTSIESVPGKVFMQEIKQLDEHVTDVRQAIMNLSDSTPKITSIAKNVGGAASKINLLALNTAVHAGVDEEAIGDLFAADEIQQYAQRIAGMSRHLTEQGDVINAIITNVAAQIETIGHSIDALRPLDQDQCTAGKQIGANNVKLIERVRNVMAIIDHQFNAASDASSCFGVIQEAIVELSADVNDIMTRVEELERLLGKLKRPQ